MEERRSVLRCECQFLIGSYIFPEDLRDPESSTCPTDLSIPVDTGRPLSEDRDASIVIRETQNMTRFLRDTLHVSRATCVIDAHQYRTGQGDGVLKRKREEGAPVR